MDFPTFQELFRVARDEMLSRNGRLTQAVIERQGSDTNLVVAGGAAIGDELVGQLVRVEAAVYLDSATDTLLDRLVFDRYGIARKAATAAVGSVVFTTTTSNPAAFAIPLNTLLGTSDGRQFLTAASATFPAFSTGPVTVAVRSVLAGADQQARIGTITSILGAIPGRPADLVVANPLATAGATDAETDDALRNRARQFWVTARRGTLAAIQNSALAVLGVVTATAFELTDVFGRPAKGVELVVSDAFTEQLIDVAPTPPAYMAQSQVLAQGVFNGLSETRAAGINVNVRIASVVLQGLQLGLRFRTGVNADSVALQARGTCVAIINSLRPGERLSVANLITALRSVTGLVVTGQEIVSPPGDVIARPLEVIRTSLALVVAVSQQPEMALQRTGNPDSV